MIRRRLRATGRATGSSTRLSDNTLPGGLECPPQQILQYCSKSRAWHGAQKVRPAAACRAWRSRAAAHGAPGARRHNHGLCAGDPTTGAELLALLRQHPNVLLFNTALEAAPQSMTMPLVELLCAGGHAGGTAWPKPGKDTGMVVLERASQQDLDSAMRRLLYAGMQPHYRVMLAWASCHARRGSVQGVRHVMQLVQEAHGTVAPHYYVQLIRVRRRRLCAPHLGAARVPPASCLHILLQAYCTRGRWKNAEGVLGEMRQQGVAPTEQVFRTLIFCLGQHHRAGACALPA